MVEGVATRLITFAVLISPVVLLAAGGAAVSPGVSWT